MQTSTIILVITGTLIFCSLFLIILAIGGLHIRQKNFEKELMAELRNQGSKISEVNVNFPFDQLFELSSKIDELIHLANVGNRMTGLSASAAAANLARIEARDELSPESAKSLTDLRTAIYQTIQFFYGSQMGPDSGSNEETDNQ